MTDFSQLEARLDAALGVLVATDAASGKNDAEIQELNAQIKELRDQLAAVQSDKKALEVRIKKAGEQLVSTKARVNRLRDGAAMLNDTIAAKDKEIAALREAHQEALG
jgi:septal ring factor EnvC (AmiA/AmiB activator)